MKKTQVFILGPPRSGTSIMFLAMREVLRLDGAGESHIFPIFNAIGHSFYRYHQRFIQRKALAARLSPTEFAEVMLPYIRSIYDKAYKSGSFVDKTPGSAQIRSCTLIHDAFPDARVLLIGRTGIEVVDSYTTKFGASFEDACSVWSECASASAHALLHFPDILALDQFELTNSPIVVAERIANYLGRPETAPGLAHFFVNRRVEQNSTHDWRRRLTLADVKWPESQKETFRRICGKQMEALGYAT